MWIRKAAWLSAALVTLSFLLILVACDGEEVATPAPTPTYNLEAAKAGFAFGKDYWDRKGSDDYTIEVEARCLCPTHGIPFRMVVKNGAIESITPVDPNEIYNDYSFFPFKIIDDLFLEIQGAVTGSPAMYLTVQYHFRLGYPVYFHINRSGMIDDGYSLVITSYTPLSPSEAAAFYDLEAARAQFADANDMWEDNGSNDYIFESVAWCNCPQSGTSLKITISKGTIESIRDMGSNNIYTGEESSDGFYPHQTINDLFREIERAVGSTPARYLGVSYHPRLGYPLYFRASFSHVIEDGYSLVITSYTPISPSSPAAMSETSSRPTDSVELRASVMDVSSGGAMVSIPPAATVEEVLDKGLRLAGASAIDSPLTFIDWDNNPQAEIPMDAAWSPDGSMLAVRIDDLHGWNVSGLPLSDNSFLVFLVDRDNTNIRPLVEYAETEESPSSPEIELRLAE